MAFSIVTLPTRRKAARRLVLEAKRRHLKVIHSHDRGWLSRYHLIEVHGDGRAVASYSRAVSRWAYMARNGEAPPDRAELVKRLLGSQSSSD